MAALDVKLRKEMQVELKNLQERLQITFLFVTHDQDEALVMSDRIAVMNAGRIEQLDGPEELYERPRTHFVADFLRVANLLRATVRSRQNGTVFLRTEGGLDMLAADDGGYQDGAAVWLGLRPEKISLVVQKTNVFEGTIDDEVFLGDWTDWRIRVGNEVLSVGEGNLLARARKRGDAVQVSFAPEDVLRLDEPERSLKDRSAPGLGSPPADAAPADRALLSSAGADVRDIARETVRIWDGRARRLGRQLPARPRPALPHRALAEPGPRGGHDHGLPAGGLPGGVVDRASRGSGVAQSPPRVDHSPVLDEFPGAHVRMDRPAAV
jgi:hypothetical protein